MKGDLFKNGFDPALFDEALSSSLTYRVLYRRAHTCPCTEERSNDDSPDPLCQICDGKGHYLEPIAPAQTPTTTLYRGSQSVAERLDAAGATITGVVTESGAALTATLASDGTVTFTGTAPRDGEAYTVTYTAPAQGRLHAQSLMSKQAFQPQGEVITGDLEASIPVNIRDSSGAWTENPAWNASKYDELTFADVEYRHQQRLRRGAKERLTFQNVKEIVECRAKVGNALKIYVRGVDFEIVGSSVTWLAGGQAPAPRSGSTPGQVYILEYICRPTYIVFNDLLRLRHVDGQRLPRSVHLRLLDSYPRKAG